MDGKELVSGAAYDVYMDIKKRTNGEIYFGVVGPVRTGKSTFIKRFMELCVLPSMKDDNKRKRAQDELPQSSGGTTVMTVEPKFIPSEAALISPFEGINMKVRLVDCVGFMVEGANGHLDNGKERMVKTPWDTKEIAFSKAAEIGTSLPGHMKMLAVSPCRSAVFQIGSPPQNPGVRTSSESKTESRRPCVRS